MNSFEISLYRLETLLITFIITRKQWCNSNEIERLLYPTWLVGVICKKFLFLCGQPIFILYLLSILFIGLHKKVLKSFFCQNYIKTLSVLKRKIPLCVNVFLWSAYMSCKGFKKFYWFFAGKHVTSDCSSEDTCHDTFDSEKCLKTL